MHRHQEHLAALERQSEQYIREIASAERLDVLAQRARKQGLVLPGERSFVIRGRLDPPAPAPASKPADRSGLFDWLPDIF